MLFKSEDKKIYISALVCLVMGMTSYFLINKLNLFSKSSNECMPGLVGENENTEKFGFCTKENFFYSGIVKKSEFLGSILNKNDVSGIIIHELEQKSKDIFDVRRIREGKSYHIVTDGECGPVKALIYEPGPLHYVVYNFSDSVYVYVGEREYYTCVEASYGIITSSLWNALRERNISPALISQMEDALSSSVDFYHVQKNDEFKLIFERKMVEDSEIGVGQLLGAWFSNDRGQHYAVYYESDKYKGFFDVEGRPTKKSFLMAPVKYSRISSPFSSSRLHLIRKVRIPHLGTDYAAPHGTPIHAVADGIVEIAGFGQNNGNFVKIRHDKTYQTQYLHMSGFAKGIKKGSFIKQGQTIGYVGSTGLATGPHVCFRFWKNGKQIDHRKENFPPSEPMAEAELPHFYIKRDIIIDYLDSIEGSNHFNLDIGENELTSI
jgi:murein DD-endopeptidase MepM/ murein hydrolase activator NlpD